VAFTSSTSIKRTGDVSAAQYGLTVSELPAVRVNWLTQEQSLPIILGLSASGGGGSVHAAMEMESLFGAKPTVANMSMHSEDSRVVVGALWNSGSDHAAFSLNGDSSASHSLSALDALQYASVVGVLGATAGAIASIPIASATDLEGHHTLPMSVAGGGMAAADMLGGLVLRAAYGEGMQYTYTTRVDINTASLGLAMNTSTTHGADVTRTVLSVDEPSVSGMHTSAALSTLAVTSGGSSSALFSLAVSELPAEWLAYGQTLPLALEARAGAHDSEVSAAEQVQGLFGLSPTLLNVSMMSVADSVAVRASGYIGEEAASISMVGSSSMGVGDSDSVGALQYASVVTMLGAALTSAVAALASKSYQYDYSGGTYKSGDFANWDTVMTAAGVSVAAMDLLTGPLMRAAYGELLQYNYRLQADVDLAGIDGPHTRPLQLTTTTDHATGATQTAVRVYPPPPSQCISGDASRPRNPP
jgi:hypothetical protein